ncbi:MAG: trehalose-phosphatase [Ktedonobacteraceae bacterium]|nr:trehalose-phosphatase [Ktedonobacteraceae bacterium]
MLPADLQAALRQQPRGLVFDIDGTLSPIVPRPDEARLYAGVAQDLKQASRLAHTAIITGRAITQGAAIVNVEGLTYIGTHGLEWSDGLPGAHPVQLIPAAQPYIEAGKALLDLAERELDGAPGIIIEHKSVGGSIHYRLAPQPALAREQILALLEEPARQAQLRLSEGKMVVEIRPPIHVNKGEALRRFARQKRLHTVVFAGDDRTDLDALLEIERLRASGLAAFAIAVQHPDTLPELLAHADLVVQGVGAMAALLHELVEYLAGQDE